MTMLMLMVFAIICGSCLHLGGSFALTSVDPLALNSADPLALTSGYPLAMTSVDSLALTSANPLALTSECKRKIKGFVMILTRS